MFNDMLLSQSEQYNAPDLIPDDLTFDSLLNLDNMVVPPVSQEITELSRKVDHLTIELNTINLRLEIEKTKRQRLQTVVRQYKRELSPQCPDLTLLRRDFDKFQELQNSTNYMLDGENTRTNTLVFRSVSRICHLLNTLIQGIYISPETLEESSILLQELISTIQQFGVHHTTSYV